VTQNNIETLTNKTLDNPIINYILTPTNNILSIPDVSDTFVTMNSE
jgi:hypothetical protein